MWHTNKLHLCNTCVLVWVLAPIKADIMHRHLDAYDEWCLSHILGEITAQPFKSEIEIELNNES